MSDSKDSSIEEAEDQNIQGVSQLSENEETKESPRASTERDNSDSGDEGESKEEEKEESQTSVERNNSMTENVEVKEEEDSENNSMKENESDSVKEEDNSSSENEAEKKEPTNAEKVEAARLAKKEKAEATIKIKEDKAQEKKEKAEAAQKEKEEKAEAAKKAKEEKAKEKIDKAEEVKRIKEEKSKLKTEKAEAAKKEKEEKAVAAQKLKEEKTKDKKEKAETAKKEKEEKAVAAKKLKEEKAKDKKEKAETAKKEKEERAVAAKKLKEEKAEAVKKAKEEKEQKKREQAIEKAAQGPSSCCCYLKATTPPAIKDNIGSLLKFTLTFPNTTIEAFDGQLQDELKNWLCHALSLDDAKRLKFSGLRAGSLIMDVKIEGVNGLASAQEMSQTLLTEINKETAFETVSGKELLQGCMIQTPPIVVDEYGDKHEIDLAPTDLVPTHPPLTETSPTHPPLTETSPTHPPLTETSPTHPPLTETSPTDPPRIETSPTDPPRIETSPTDQEIAIMKEEFARLSSEVEKKKAELIDLESAALRAKQQELATLEYKASESKKTTSTSNIQAVKDLLDRTIEDDHKPHYNASISMVDLDTMPPFSPSNTTIQPPWPAANQWETYFDNGDVVASSQHKHHHRKRSVPSSIPPPPPFPGHVRLNNNRELVYSSSKANRSLRAPIRHSSEAGLWSQIELLLAQCDSSNHERGMVEPYPSQPNPLVHWSSDRTQRPSHSSRPTRRQTAY